MSQVQHLSSVCGSLALRILFQIYFGFTRDEPRLYLDKIKLLITNTLNTVPFNQFALLLSAETAACLYLQELSGNQFDVKITEQDIAHPLLRHITKLDYPVFVQAAHNVLTSK